MYGRILSSAVFEIPWMASQSSTRRNEPLFSRKLIMDFAVAGPMPGTCRNSAADAEFKSTGCAGGVFRCALDGPAKTKSRNAAASKNSRRANLLFESNATCSRTDYCLLP
jgi:hypothetical protein